MYARFIARFIARRLTQVRAFHFNFAIAHTTSSRVPTRNAMRATFMNTPSHAGAPHSPCGAPHHVRLTPSRAPHVHPPSRAPHHASQAPHLCTKHVHHCHTPSRLAGTLRECPTRVHDAHFLAPSQGLSGPLRRPHFDLAFGPCF
jgi:hypothetical protein